MLLNAGQTAALREILERVLTKVSPDEVMLIQDNVGTRGSNKGFDGMLGFGAASETLLVLPILLGALKEFASTATADLAKKWGADLASWMTDHPGHRLQQSALQTLEDVIKAKLEQRGFSTARAAQVTDCIIATLASHPNLLTNLASHK